MTEQQRYEVVGQEPGFELRLRPAHLVALFPQPAGWLKNLPYVLPMSYRGCQGIRARLMPGEAAARQRTTTPTLCRTSGHCVTWVRSPVVA